MHLSEVPCCACSSRGAAWVAQSELLGKPTHFSILHLGTEEEGAAYDLHLLCRHSFTLAAPRFDLPHPHRSGFSLSGRLSDCLRALGGEVDCLLDFWSAFIYLLLSVVQSINRAASAAAGRSGFALHQFREVGLPSIDSRRLGVSLCRFARTRWEGRRGGSGKVAWFALRREVGVRFV